MKLHSSFALLLLAVPATAQTTLLVPFDQPTIQSGIAAAAPGDTVLVSAGTYNEQIDFLGKAITVRSVAGAGATTIDSEGAAEWPDFPFGPVVRMIGGEGRDSVLEGFTITGGQTNGIGSTGYSGVYCANLSPTIRKCIITDNSGGTGGGVLGDALIENCEITNNDSLPYGEGGGIYGSPTIVDSLIQGNRSGGIGGGLFATGPCTVTGSVFDSNLAGNGADGYTGGGLAGPATVIDSVFSRNEAHHYFSGGPPDVIGTAVDGAAALIGCTIVDNRVANGAVPNDESGALRNVQTVENCIVWGNEVGSVAVGSNPAMTYTLVEGGFAGVGNFDLNPLFLDAVNGDYFLTPNSPAIDAGNPLSPLDPDGTTADLGAFPFPQFAASALVNAGSGANPGCYTTLLTPVIGSLWGSAVQTNAHGSPGLLSVLVGYPAPLAPLDLGFGELLVDPSSPLIFSEAAAPVGGIAAYTLPVPSNYAIGGLTIHTQAVVLDGQGVIGLCNGLDLTLGL